MREIKGFAGIGISKMKREKERDQGSETMGHSLIIRHGTWLHSLNKHFLKKTTDRQFQLDPPISNHQLVPPECLNFKSSELAVRGWDEWELGVRGKPRHNVSTFLTVRSPLTTFTSLRIPDLGSGLNRCRRPRMRHLERDAMDGSDDMISGPFNSLFSAISNADACLTLNLQELSQSSMRCDHKSATIQNALPKDFFQDNKKSR
ncbi:uncharacterized protein BDR25DRAFT_348050 [Lindgomyces ingoldianus]|uniref:Uncharacterized protein n=1 Tax=Lindgomyces ingoldianus TaxID=673940 RepID=A0ACB6RGU1_9PLEO|nr:uncharacterized protein BDR25DRAFT_348050 [Lindgomyces ingoldianus]KAF2477732.1 hypothetical protein BDR25DRAFT_348050 [Lindgomyces ingoldianus]